MSTAWTPLNALLEHQAHLRQCSRCPDMIPPVIVGQPVLSKVMSIGQAPGIHEGRVMRPFGWTAGKTLFKWFEPLGLDEAAFRERVYMAAVCRCFPGKLAQGGDRLPSPEEIARCAPWLHQELRLLEPELLILVGKLAISQFMPVKKLEHVVGRLHPHTVLGRAVDLLPLPHPSGLSTWPRMEPGKRLLAQALGVLEQHPAWQRLLTPSVNAGLG